MKPYIKSNKILWDELAKAHLNDPFYQVAAFRQGKDSLHAPEIALLGDLQGLKVLHLQCHFGLDTLSLARRGAQVTGVDFSPEALKIARKLSEETGWKADFLEGDITDGLILPSANFDLIFTSYGVIHWLPDLKVWSQAINHHLKSGGRFVMVEFHPLLQILDNASLSVVYSYFHEKKPVKQHIHASYTGKKIPSKDEFTWNHPLDSILQTLISNGLNITDFREYDFSPYPCYENMTMRRSNEFIVDTKYTLPHLFSVVAKKNP